MRRFAGVASTIFACLAGCGHEDHFTDAGGEPDANHNDASSAPDAGVPGDVTVTTHTRCCVVAPGLEQNVQVVAVQPDGTVADTGFTDASGNVTLSGVMPGAAVSATYQITSTSYQLVTMLGVKPGDHLVFGDDYGVPTTGVDGAMTASWPDYAGATDYYVQSRCASASALSPTLSVSIAEYAYCQAATSDLVFYAYASGALLATGTIHDAPFTDGATAALPSWTPAHTVDTSISGLDPSVTGVTAYIYSTWDVSSYNQLSGLAQIGGTASYSPLMPGDADRLYVEYDSTRTAQAGTHVSGASAAGDATTLDLTDPGMPWLGQAYFNAATHSAGWTQTDGNYDAAVATSSWEHFDGKVYTDYYWTVVAPPGVTGWTWNDPPAEIQSYLPLDSDFINGDVVLIDLANAADYDELRAQPEWLLQCAECDAHTGAIAGTSSSAYSYSSGEGFAAHQRTMRPALRNHR